ncbi:MAG: FecR domain-containing protein [Gallionella sp.]|nr:FecR domain-containing protein [Gallionella sp.]
MNNVKKLFARLVILIACLSGVHQSACAAVAGHVQFVSGDVQITNPAGQTHQAQKGEVISEGDTLTSAPSASAQIKMQDGGFVAVRADTKLKFDQFVFAGKQDGSEKSFFSLFKGGFRAVTGLIGQINKQNYKITTPAATIGIRGTDHETMLIVPSSSLAQIAPTGAYSKVNVGETTLTTNRGTINVMPNQMGFAGGMDQAPKLQPLNTNIFTVAAAPLAAKADKKEEKKEDKKEQAESKQGEKSAKGDKEEKKDGKQADKGNGDAKAKEGTQAAKQEGAATETKQAKSEQAAPASSGQGTATNGSQDAAAGGAAPAPDVAAVPAPAPAPIRTTAAVDTIAPNTALIQPVAPVVAAPAVIATPIVAPLPVYVPPPIITTTTGTVFNPVVQTATTAGQVTTVVTAPVVTTAIVTAVPADNRIAWELGAWWWGQALSVPADVAPLANPPSFTDRYGLNSAYSTNITMNGATGAVNGTAAGGIQFGSWSNVTNPTFTDFYPFGPGGTGMAGSPWIYGPMGYRDPSTPIAGAAYSYVMDSATAPTNFSAGLAGTLNSATLTANFAANTVDIALGLTYAGIAWGATATGMPITGGNGSFVGTMAITQNAAACAICWGNVQGGFTGQNYVGAIAQYSLWDGMSSGGIDGAVAFTRGAGPAVVNTTPVAGLGFAVYDQLGWPGSATTVVNTGNVLTGYTSPNQSFSVACAAGGCTGAPAAQALTGALTGIYLGTWSSGTVTWSGSGTTGPQHWITGPVAGPAYLPEVLLGSATYSMSGGSAPTGIAGAAGTLNSASLTVNFTQQTVAVALSATVAGNTYVVSTPAGGEAPLTGSYGNNSVNSAFWFNVNCVGCIGNGSVNVVVNNTATVVTSGYISGQLTGQGLTGAILSYQLSTLAPVVDTVQGVAAFGLSPGTPINTATAYRLAGGIIPTGLFQGNSGGAIGGYNNSTRAIFDAAANLTQFDANTNGWPNTLSITGATAMERGTDPISGISWGRWAGGTLSTQDRTVVGATPFTQATPASGVHWIAGPNMTGPVDLPVSGTFNYVFAGGTTPTDQAGTTGVLQGATLSANFTAMTVNTGVTVAMPTATITANATGLPITNGFFGGDSKMIVQAGITSSVTCAGAGCGAAGTHSAKVNGVFTGAGGIGAAVLYGLQTGATTVGGVAAFHR